MSRRVLIDFDGTLVARGSGRKMRSIPGAAEAIRSMQKLGYVIDIYSCRAGRNDEWGAAHIQRWLDANGLHIDSITDRKTDADIYIDDKALAFTGDWSDTLWNVLQRDSATRESAS